MAIWLQPFILYLLSAKRSTGYPRETGCHRGAGPGSETFRAEPAGSSLIKTFCGCIAASGTNGVRLVGVIPKSNQNTIIPNCDHRSKKRLYPVGAHLRVRPRPGRTHRSAPTRNKLPVLAQLSISCHSECSEESLFVTRRDSSLRYVPFRMT